jgi:YD repeat-containing protein
MSLLLSHRRTPATLFATLGLMGLVLAGTATSSLAATTARDQVPAHSRLVDKYTTADSNTYRLANGHMLTRVYEHPINERNAAGQWQPLTEKQSAAAQAQALASPMQSATPDAERNPLGQEDEAACTLTSTLPTTSACNELTFKAGYETSSKSARRALVQFTLPDLHEELILLNAQLELYATSTTTTSTTAMGAYRVTTPWTTKATWNTSNGTTAWHTAGGDYANPEKESDAAINPSVGASKGWTYWYPTKMVQEWYNGTAAPNGQGQADLGFLLRDVSEGTTNNVVSFAGHEERERDPGLTLEWVDRGVGNATNYTQLPTQLSSTLSLNVNPASGNLMIHSNDLQVPSKGLEFDSARNWNSLENEAPGYGYGWVDANAVYVQATSSGSVAYTDGTGDSFPFIKEGANFKTPAGIEATMCAAGSAAPCPTTLPKGATYQLIYTNTGERVNFGQKEYEFLYVVSVEDAASEAQSAHYTSGLEYPTSWTDTEGTKIAYAENASTGYTKITDEGNGHSTSYSEQEGEDGLPHLVQYTNENKEVTKYRYGGESFLEGNLLTEITEPNGTVIKLSYNSDYQITKIIKTTNAEHTKGPTTSYTYYELGKAPAPCTTTQKATVVTEAEGNGEPALTYCSNVLDEVEKVSGYANTGQPGWYSLEDESDSESAMASVNVAGGNLLVENEDLSPEEATSDLRLDRFYNSQAPAAAKGTLGPRWSWNAGPSVYLRDYGVSVVLHGPNGYVVTLQRQPAGAYTAPEGFEGSLTKNANGTYTLSGVEGAIYQFSTAGAVTSYTNEEGKTFTVTDTTLSGKSVLHALAPATGKALEVTYNGTPLVTQTTDPAGHIRKYEYNASLQLSKYIDPSGKITEYGYETSGYLNKITTPNGTVETITTTAGKVSEVKIAPKGEATYGEKFTYAAPTTPTCNPATDTGETVVTQIPVVEGEMPETYCSNSLGQITGYTGPEGESEKDPTEGSPEEQKELPAGTCYPNPEFPATECGQEDPLPENEELKGDALLGAQPLATGGASIPDLGPTHYGIADNNMLTSFNIFESSYFKALHVVNVRRTVPWDTVYEANHNPSNTVAKAELADVKNWVKAVKALSNNTGQPTISIDICNPAERWTNPQNPTETLSCKVTPSKAQYEAEIKEFLAAEGLKEVKYFTAWNEPNRPVAGEPTATQAGNYWRVLDELCDHKAPKCEVAAGEFLDSNMPDANDNKSTGGKYFAEYVKAMGHPTTAYRWAWHAYSDGEYAGLHYSKPSTWWTRFKNFHNAIDKVTTGHPADIWLTEQGVIYSESGKERAAFHNGNIALNIIHAYVENGTSQLTRQSRQITRFFYYQVHGASNKSFDSGFLFPGGTPATAHPRQIYYAYKNKTPTK